MSSNIKLYNSLNDKTLEELIVFGELSLEFSDSANSPKFYSGNVFEDNIILLNI